MLENRNGFTPACILQLMDIFLVIESASFRCDRWFLAVFRYMVRSGRVRGPHIFSFSTFYLSHGTRLYTTDRTGSCRSTSGQTKPTGRQVKQVEDESGRINKSMLLSLGCMVFSFKGLIFMVSPTNSFRCHYTYSSVTPNSAASA